MSQKLVDRVKAQLADAVISAETFRGDETIVVKRERILEVLGFLRDDAECKLDFARTVTAIDWLGYQGEARSASPTEVRSGALRSPSDDRFEVVYILYSIAKRHSLRVKVSVPEDDISIATCTGIYPGMNWFEREVFDMYGVVFTGHPDLRRMFMYEEFVGHPLRKDYPKEKRQPLFRREGMT